MAYVQKSIQSKIGKQVMLTKDIESMAGSFEAGSIVTITEVDPVRGFSFSDERLGSADRKSGPLLTAVLWRGR